MPSLLLNQQANELAFKYQREDAAFIVKNRCVVLGHKTGMGKSLIGLMAWEQLKPNRVLILGGKSAASTWNKEPMVWADTQIDLGAADIRTRNASWMNAANAKEGIWYMTYEMYRRCMLVQDPGFRPHFDLVIADEAHKLRSRTTKLYTAMRKLQFDAFIPMSATWASRGPQDLWAILHLINKKRFSSYWSFVDRYCYVENTGFGNEIFGIRNQTELQRSMNFQFYRTRTWEEIGYEVPPIRRELIKLEMHSDQKKVTKELDAEMMTEHDGKFLVTQSVLAKITRLHQLATVPFVLFPDMIGAGMEYILEAIEDDPHTVIYTFYTEAIPAIEEMVRAKGYKTWALRGGTKMEEVDRRVSEWKQHKGIMVCSVKFAESFRIDTTHTAYVLGFSFDPNENIQAEGRLRAIDSKLKSPVLVKYLVMQGSIQEHVLEVVNEKHKTVSQIFRDYTTAKGLTTI